LTSAVREERKVLTALFVDVVGSTALADRLDAEEVKLVVGEAVATRHSATPSISPRASRARRSRARCSSTTRCTAPWGSCSRKTSASFADVIVEPVR